MSYVVNPQSKFAPGTRGQDANGPYVVDAAGNAHYLSGQYQGVAVGDKYGDLRLGVGPDYSINPSSGTSEQYIGNGEAPPTAAAATTVGTSSLNDLFSGSSGGSGTGGSFTPYTKPQAFSFEKYQAPAPFQTPQTIGNFTPNAAFQAPTMDEVTADPSFQFRLKEGQNALERSASSRGSLLTGGTLKDLLNYGQDAASQEWDKVYGRKFNEWSTNEGTAERAFGLNADAANANNTTALNAYNTNAQTGLGAYTANLNNAFNSWNANTGLDERTFDRNASGLYADRVLGINDQQNTLANLFKLAGMGGQA